MNCIPKIAEMLGVELGEEFKFDQSSCTLDGTYRFAEDGLWEKSKNGDGSWELADSPELAWLVRGNIEILKKPWMPKMYEYYFVIDKTHRGGNFYEPQKLRWYGDVLDFIMCAAGNCFKTSEEALEAIPWLKKNIERLKMGEKWEARK